MWLSLCFRIICLYSVLYANSIHIYVFGCFCFCFVFFNHLLFYLWMPQIRSKFISISTFCKRNKTMQNKKYGLYIILHRVWSHKLICWSQRLVNWLNVVQFIFFIVRRSFFHSAGRGHDLCVLMNMKWWWRWCEDMKPLAASHVYGSNVMMKLSYRKTSEK